MKITIETIDNKLVTVTLDYMDKQYRETWEQCASGYQTTGKGITTQLEENLEDLIDPDSDEYDEATADNFEKIEEIIDSLPTSLILYMLFE